ncbi:RNA polymerase subunit sigma [Williamsia sp. Leaf354]|uniref:SigB/SigF/SigG family RNA polymerase sigma factor n=1 Tax=Williamsia sp. Leaf354 TaxID=1736349 RepID=UPI0006FCA7A6|nr:RNA polymerase subunit sigma [Williamsia sp. Leaf354]
MAPTLRGGRPEPRRARRDDDYTDVAARLAALAELDRSSTEFVCARIDVISRCLPLADNIARRYGGRGEAFDDLVQVARLGLVNAVDRFDPTRGSDFLAFAVPTVMGEVRRHFRDATWSLRVPRRTKESYLQIAKVSDAMLQRLGRSPRPSEIAAEMDLDLDAVVDGLVAHSAYHAGSLDAEITGDASTMRLQDTLGDLDARMGAVEHAATLRPALARLTVRERQIVGLRFFGSMSQSQIAARVGISQMHVSRILSTTLATLRADLDDAALDGV